MYKAVSFWSPPKPEDEAEFEDYYMNVHVPFAERIPGAVRLLLTRTTDGMEAPPAFYRVAELWFEDKADLEKATKTPEWAEMRADAAKVHERFGVELKTGLGTQVDGTMQSR
jgi:uncharacterized protein (TIGR02118 family)